MTGTRLVHGHLVRAVVDVNVLISAALSARGPSAEVQGPPDPAPVSSPDPDDDYLLAVAISRRAFLVTGDQHLLGPREDLRILTPAEFVSKLRDNG